MARSLEHLDESLGIGLSSHNITCSRRMPAGKAKEEKVIGSGPKKIALRIERTYLPFNLAE